MHQLVREHVVTRSEFLRGLEGITADEGLRAFGPMNSMSWIMGHLATSEYFFFVTLPQGKEMHRRLLPFVTGSPRSTPPLMEVTNLWNMATREADKWLLPATEADMLRRFLRPDGSEYPENGGTLVLHSMFHYWSHLGETSAIRQMLGHQAPEFVNRDQLDRCAYGKG